MTCHPPLSTVRGKMKVSITASLSALAGLAVISCGPSDPQSNYLRGMGGPIQQQASGGPSHSPPAIHDDVSYWDGDGVTGAPLIKINRSEQKAYFYKGGQLVGISKISSGNEDHATPPGRYKITQKDKDHKSSAYGCFKDRATGAMINDNVDIRVDKIPPGAIYYPAPMPNFMRFAGGIGMHTGYLPGYAASHGCIRMPHHMSTKFFENVEVGTPVIVE
ncbi:MAG: L,D-transpeptidase family protein [Luteolibacter sp.]